jgi:hypothetical protein
MFGFNLIVLGRKLFPRPCQNLGGCIEAIEYQDKPNHKQG